MSITKTLGGDRVGSGQKMKVELHNFERSTHDLSYIWRSTMSAGTLPPFMTEVMLPGDTFDVYLDCDIKTHPTIGPLFGSYKVQLDVYVAPVRLYMSALHNNMLNIGRNMAQIQLPKIRLEAPTTELNLLQDINTAQVNPSCLLAYLGIRGIGINSTEEVPVTRDFNAIALLMYWETYKNYYANKQEQIGMVIHTDIEDLITTITQIEITNYTPILDTETLPLIPATPNAIPLKEFTTMEITYAVTPPLLNQIMLNTNQGIRTVEELFTLSSDTGTILNLDYKYSQFGLLFADNWRYRNATDGFNGTPSVEDFPLENIDEMRIALLQTLPTGSFFVNDPNIVPYRWLIDQENGIYYRTSTQEGLGIKTYQSDIFNNWLSTEWIDGAGGINSITAIDTSGGSFTLDQLILSRKVFNMLNRIAVSGGTYQDYIEAAWAHKGNWNAESPVYVGGLSKELMFQEVVSNSASSGDDGPQPLGTLAGKGIMGKKHKGGHIIVKVDEPSYLMGIISLTPRIDYSQGNKWDVALNTMDDFHKPDLDQIGFQELITEKMAWWDTFWDQTTLAWITRSAGKQPAWIDYMTNFNRTYGNFAVESNEMFMTLNRKYQPNISDFNTVTIQDLTTYIDPAKFNFIFANTALDAQNFWAQISVDITARRKMSAKIMPNL